MERDAPYGDVGPYTEIPSFNNSPGSSTRPINFPCRPIMFKRYVRRDLLMIAGMRYFYVLWQIWRINQA